MASLAGVKRVECMNRTSRCWGSANRTEGVAIRGFEGCENGEQGFLNGW